MIIKSRNLKNVDEMAQSLFLKFCYSYLLYFYGIRLILEMGAHSVISPSKRERDDGRIRAPNYLLYKDNSTTQKPLLHFPRRTLISATMELIVLKHDKV